MSFASEWRKRREMATLPATVMVEKATSDLLTEPDWAVNMDVCDLVNSDLRQARDVVKTVKKRLLQKSPTVQFLALTLLETMIKNCGAHVHHQVVECGVLDEMVKIAKKKSDMLVRNKILILMDAWQGAFAGPQGQYPQYFWAYAELKGSGIKFPPRSGDTAPIFTPPITNPTPRNPSQPENSSSVRLDEAIASEKGILSLSDFHSIRGVMELLKDMLEAVNQNDCEALQDEVIIDLVQQCCSNQKKIMHLINSTRNEELLFLALALNDDLQDLIIKYNGLATGQPVPSEESQSLPAKNLVSAKTSEQLEEEEDENDGFTQLARRNSNIQHASSNIQSSQNVSMEPSANRSATSGERSITTSSPSSSVPAMTDQSGADIANRWSTLSIGQPPQPSNPIANSSTFILPTPSSSMNSYNSSTMLSSPIMPSTLNPLGFSTSQYSVPNLSVNPATYPYNAHPHPINQGYIPYNGYVAPWAQQSLPQTIYQVQPEEQGNISSYPPPPWETSPSCEDDDFTNEHIENEPTSSNPPQLHSLIDSRGDVTIDSRTATAADVPSHLMLKDQVEIQKDEEVKQTAGTSSMQQHHGQLWMEGSDPPRPPSKVGIAHANL